MARPAAQALAGFYPTPTTLMARIAGLVQPCADKERTVTLLDPCAGEGAALDALVEALAPGAHTYACELEATRHKELAKAHGRTALQGDAFRVQFAGEGASLLYLNPPYDHDREHARLEQRWLARFTPALREGGVLLLVVPHYALGASADWLATHYAVHHCFRFPDGEFAAYKQCVLVATRVEERLKPDARVRGAVLGYAEAGERLHELPRDTRGGLVPMPMTPRWGSTGFTTWKMGAVDYAALLARHRAWHATGRGGLMQPVEGVEPQQPLADMLLRTYPLATPPRPAHIAAGISSGLFNGARLEPNAASPFTAPLLVKGVFDREYKTVDERTNKDGEVTALVQVQQPKLVVTVLDLHAHRYHVLGSDGARGTTVEGLTVAGLLEHYGDALMGVMRRQCPVLHDPHRDKPLRLARTPRRLFRAQAHAVAALLKLLRGNPAAILLGEIGSGKSTVALSTARTHGAARPLVLCPPHLLQSWRDEVAAVFPDARVHVLGDVQAVQDYAALPPGGFHVAVLSREAAKLSHAWRGVAGPCPRCGAPTGAAAADLARRRARCESAPHEPQDELARYALALAEQLAPHAPTHPTIEALLGGGRHARRRLARNALGLELLGERRYPGIVPATLHRPLAVLACMAPGENVDRAIARLLLACGDDALTARAAAALYAARENDYDNLGVGLAHLLPPHGELQRALAAEGEAAKRPHQYHEPWHQLATAVSAAQRGEWCHAAGLALSWKDGTLLLDGEAPRSLQAALSALTSLVKAARWRQRPSCGEPLYQAVPEPRRVALAQHIHRFHPDMFDFLVLDEGHEYASDASAQSFSAHRLSGLGKPTVLMTGTIMNGYAESLYTNMWALSPSFRREFDRGDKQRFVDRYGYRKRVVEDRVDGAVVAYGSQSDRVERSERAVGNAPGVLPLFLLRHLLPAAVTLHKADLAIDLPPLTQEVARVDPGHELAKRFERLKKALVDQIKSDRFAEGLAGKLWGQLAELPSYLDRATLDAGNCDAGDYEVRYPEECSAGGKLVACERGLPEHVVQPKENWMLDRVRAELAEGRNVLVFAWHTKLLPRLRDLLQAHLGEPVPLLDAGKVGTAKRQAWIDANVVRPGRRVLVANPVAVQTGLNNLVHFATEVWMENPACNPVTFRQAVGRIDRIGQRLPTRVLVAVYRDTLQEQLQALLARKVAVSVATDGLDPEQALLAAGVGESDALAALSIGRQLWALMTGDAA